jgi:hypothetical protein
MPIDWNSIAVFASGSAFGAIGAAVWTQRKIGSREARDRKDAFRGHLGRWIGALHQRHSDYRLVHMEFAPHVMGYCGRLMKDFGIFRRHRFIHLCEDVSKSHWDNPDYQDNIQKLIAFI